MKSHGTTTQVTIIQNKCKSNKQKLSFFYFVSSAKEILVDLPRFKLSIKQYVQRTPMNKNLFLGITNYVLIKDYATAINSDTNEFDLEVFDLKLTAIGWCSWSLIISKTVMIRFNLLIKLLIQVHLNLNLSSLKKQNTKL